MRIKKFIENLYAKGMPEYNFVFGSQ